MNRKEIYIPKFYESPSLKRDMEAWKNGDYSRERRRKLVRAYKDHLRLGFFMKKETKEYIEQEVLPLFWQKNYRNIKSIWLKKLKEQQGNEDNSD
ncbi:MAG: hypothetical protein ACRCX2_00035 [Paraclostridium sp.]